MNPGTAAPLSLAATDGTSVPFIRLDSAFPDLFAELMETVERIAGQSAFTLGPELESFEAAFAEFCGTGFAAGVSSGTAALEIALRALGIGPGDEVIVPTYSFIATAEAVSTVGATPVIVDVDPETALITGEIVEAALTERTRCVIPVHLFGRPVEMVPLLALCRARGIAVVEDACQAHGALYKRPPGRLLRRRRLLQLLPDQEPRRLGRRRRARHQRPRPRPQGAVAALPRRGASATTTSWRPEPTASTRCRRRSSRSSCATCRTGTSAAARRPRRCAPVSMKPP